MLLPRTMVAAAAGRSSLSSVTTTFSFPPNPHCRTASCSRPPRLPLRLLPPPHPAWPRSRSRASVSASPAAAQDYEFADGNGEVELRLDIGKLGIENSGDVFVDVDDTSLLIRAKSDGTLRTLTNIKQLFDRIKSSETIWFIDEDQLVVNLKKVERELKWPDIDESWESLTSGITQLLTGISVHIVGDSTDINEAVAKEIAEGIGYLPVCTSELLESATQKSIDKWVASEGVDSVAEAECVVLESLSSHVRTVVATLGGKQGAAGRFDRWQYLHAGFTVWLSVSDANDEASAKEEARRSVGAGNVAYAKADVVVKLGGWDPEYTRAVAQGCLVALKQLTLADKKLAGKKSLYMRLGCRGDWPAIQGLLRQVGLTFGLISEVPSLIAMNIEAGLREMLDGAGVVDDDRNSLFWALHPGGRAILDKVEAALGLKPEKTRASRKVLAEYGNMGSACVWFVLDEMRRWSAAEGCGTTGEGCEWGVLCGFGPGLTMDTVLLRSAHI